VCLNLRGHDTFEQGSFSAIPRKKGSSPGVVLADVYYEWRWSLLSVGRKVWAKSRREFPKVLRGDGVSAEDSMSWCLHGENKVVVTMLSHRDLITVITWRLPTLDLISAQYRLIVSIVLKIGRLRSLYHVDGSYHSQLASISTVIVQCCIVILL
jgi:hypothetical protein